MTLIVRSYINEDWPIGRKRYLDPQWLCYRIKFYLTYTIPSLLKQTDLDFHIWLDCRPGSEDELEPYWVVLQEAGVNLTFDRGKRFLNNLEGSPSDVMVTRIDSDDCYAPDAIALIKRLHGNHQATQFTDGFIYLVQEKQAYPMQHYSPPFYTLRLQIDENGLVDRPHKGHNAVRDTFNALILPPGKICMLRHGKQGTVNALGRPMGKVFGPGTSDWNRLMETFSLNNPTQFWRSRDCPKIKRLLNIYD